MNILFVINGLGGGGSQKNTSIIANHYSNNGHNVSIAVLFDDCKPFFTLSKKIEIVNLVKGKDHRKNHFLFWLKNIKKILKTRNIDVVVAIGYRFGLLCSFCVKKQKLIIRGTKTKEISLMDKYLFKIANKKINVIVAQTHKQKETYPSYLKRKIVVLPNPFITFKHNNNIEGFTSKHLVCVGRIFLEQKRQDFIIKSLISFFKAHPDFCIDFYGSLQIDDDGGTMPKLLSIIQNNDIEKNVFFHNETKEIFKKVLPCFAFICASKEEGMPNAMIEASLNGIIPISTYWAGVDEIIKNGVDGFYCSDNDDACFFKNTIEKLLQDNSLYREISDNCVYNNNGKYNEQSVLEIWDTFLN